MQEKEVRMLEECELTSALLKSGLHSLRRADMGDKGNYYRAFFELSIAIERLLKIITPKKPVIPNFGTRKNTNTTRANESKRFDLKRKVCSSNPFKMPSAIRSTYIKGTSGAKAFIRYPTELLP